jgi:ATP-dependent DNA helicase RecG
VEEPESVLVTNAGEFLPGSVEQVLAQDAPPVFYRNRLLAQAMVSFNMIDTIGSGIKRMFVKQRDRFFPMPDYDLSQPGQVCVGITGKVIDERYTRLLMQRLDLSLADVIALDKVQKHRPLTEEEFRSVKSRRLAEGRRPNLFVSAKVAAATDTWADYVQKRAFDKDYYKRLVAGYLKKCGRATRQQLDGLLVKKLSDALTPVGKSGHFLISCVSGENPGHVTGLGHGNWRVTIADCRLADSGRRNADSGLWAAGRTQLDCHTPVRYS